MNPETWDGAGGTTPLLRRAFHNWQRVERRRCRRIGLWSRCKDAGRLALVFSPWSVWSLTILPDNGVERARRALRWARRKRGPLQLPPPRGWRYWTRPVRRGDNVAGRPSDG